MKEIVVSILGIVAPVSVALVVFSQGLGIAPSRVLGLFRQRPWLMLRSLLAVLVLVPAGALAILLGLHPTMGLAIALAILVSCPPAPLMVSSAPKQGASAELMASLHLCLAALACLTVPAVLYVLSTAIGFEAEINLGTMLWILARTILIPIGLGLTIRGLFPAVADRLAPILGKVGKIGVIVVVLFALVALYPALLSMDLGSYLVIALISATSLAIGHFAGPADAHERASLAVECGVRHPALALAIAGANFSPAKAMPVLVPCILTFILIAMLYLAVSARLHRRKNADMSK